MAVAINHTQEHYSCANCGRIHTGRNPLLNHEKWCGRSNVDVRVCPCGWQYRRIQYFKIHMESVHKLDDPNEPKPIVTVIKQNFSCECGKEYTTKAGLNWHIRNRKCPLLVKESTRKTFEWIGNLLDAAGCYNKARMVLKMPEVTRSMTIDMKAVVEYLKDISESKIAAIVEHYDNLCCKAEIQELFRGLGEMKLTKTIEFLMEGDETHE